jgi:hypothetical protein
MWKDPATRSKIEESLKKAAKNPDTQKRKSKSLKATNLSESVREKRSLSQKKSWNNVAKRQKASNAAKKNYQNPEIKARHLKSLKMSMDLVWKTKHAERCRSDEFRERARRSAIELWKSTEYREEQSKSSSERWKDKSIRENIMNARMSYEGRRNASKARIKVWSENRQSMMEGQKKRCILTDAQVLDIRSSVASIRAKAKEYNVAFDTIRKCKMGITYTHV